MQLSSIFENTNDFICTVDIESRSLLHFNEAMSSYFSTRNIQLEKGKKITELLQGDLLQNWQWLLDQAIQKSPFEFVYTSPETSRIIKNSLNQLIKEGKAYAISIITTDMTDFVQLDNELKERNLFIESIINLNPDTLYIYDIIEQKNIFSNKGIEKTLGYTFDEVAAMGSQLIPLLMHPEDIIIYEEKIIPLYRAAKDEQQIVHQYRMRDKTDKWHWIESTEIIFKRLEDGSAQQILGYGKDITDRKTLEQQVLNSVIETEEKERQFFSQELHDGIGPLLSASKMYVQWLSLPNIHIEKSEIIKDIEKLLDEAMQTIHDISFKLSPHILQNFGLTEAVKAFTSKVSAISSIAFQFHTEGQIRIAEKLEIIAYRAICECINNSIKHSGASIISISIYFVDDTLKIHYSDNGCGFNVEKALNEHNGIGLLNMQSRLKSVNGLMDIQSSAQGSIFIFQFKINNV
jgi:PAS domain S-box-containing protein